MYMVQWLFAAVLLGLSGARIHYTLHIPPGDPLNGGNDFYGKYLVVLCLDFAY